MIKGRYELESNNPSPCVTTLLCLVVLGLLEVEIQRLEFVV